MSKNITKNAGLMTMASILQKAIAFAYFILLARYLSVESVGYYTTALTFTTVFVVFVDIGLTNVFIREAAKDASSIQKYFSTLLWVKLFLGAGAYIAVAITAGLLQYETVVFHMILLSGVTMLLDSLHLSMYGALRAKGILKYEAFGIIISQLGTLLLGGIFIWMNLPLIFFILAFTIPSFFNLLYAATMAKKHAKVKFFPKKDNAALQHLWKIAVPFAIAAILARLYSYQDIFFLSKLQGATAVGIYAIATKVTFAFQFIPMALVAVVYPRFSEFCENNTNKLARVFERSMVYLFIIVLPITVGIATLAPDIVMSVFGEKYIQSIVPLQILMMSLVFSFVSFPIGALLNACHYQKVQTTIVAVVLVCNAVINALLVPIWGSVGSAIAAFAGNAILTLAGYWYVPKITKAAHIPLWPKLMRMIMATIIMGALVWYSNGVMSYIWAIVVGVVSYPIAIFALGALSREEVQTMMKTLRA